MKYLLSVTAQFQKKCLGKMGEVSKGGRTVLFVSHNMGVIRTLCPRAILLDQGRLKLDDSASNVLHEFSQSSDTFASDG